MKALNRLEEWLITFLMGAATIIIFVAVVHRYLTGFPIPALQNALLKINMGWAQELCIIMFVWMAKFGAAYGVRTGIHVGVDVLINRLDGKKRAKFILFGLFAGAVFTSIIAVLGGSFVWENGAHYAFFNAFGLDTDTRLSLAYYHYQTDDIPDGGVPFLYPVGKLPTTGEHVYRPTFGGNLFGTIVCPDTRPQMATIRPKVFELAPTDTTRTGEVEEFTPTWRTTDPQVFVEKVIEKVKADVDITKADILVGAGRGAENCLDVLQKVADELGGVVCCTRAVVEDGFLDKDRQVGQTGKTVRPSLYIACGISGAVQHCAGMDKSDLIISINRDPQAEISTISNMGFVGDVQKVLPLLVESIKAAKAE